MKRIAPGYYRENRTIDGKVWEVELVKVEGQPYWYWDAGCDEDGIYNRGGDDWYSTKTRAAESLEEAIKEGLI